MLKNNLAKKLSDKKGNIQHLVVEGSKNNNQCNDTISRQAAIETTWEEPSFTDPINVLTEVRDKLKALPSVRLDYDCVLKQFGDCTYDTTGCSDCVIKAKIKAALSAQSEIIRCNDCKFYIPMNRETKSGICSLLMHQNFGDNWYCAGAERRTDEGN